VAAFFSPAFLALLGPAAVLTAPPGPPGPNAVAGGFVFAAAGDYSFGSNLQPSLDRLVGSNVDFLVGLGDLSYGSTSEQNFCQTVKAAMPNFTIVTGNHDSGESGGGNINNYVQYCPYTLPGPMTGTYGKEYWFDYPSPGPLARFILISPGVDMNVDGTGTWDYSVGTARYNFVRDTIDGARTAGIPWVFVGMHKNCITTGNKGCEIGEDLFNLLLDRKVDLVMEGHDHNVQRSKQLFCPAILVDGYDPTCVVDDGADDFYTKGSGLELIIAGSMGQCCYGVSASDPEAGYFAKIKSDSRGYYKYTVLAGSLTAEFINATGSFTDTFSIGGTPLPRPLSGSFTVSPANPRTDVTATFTAAAIGGETPYLFSWSFGDATSATGSPAGKAYETAGTYTATLTVTDGGGNTTTATQSITVSDPPPAAPYLRGWGGVRISEAATPNGTTPSLVFTGEMASNAERTMRKLVADGYTAVRLYFESPITQAARVDPAWEWDATWFSRALDIAIFLDLWVVVDFHGYCDWLYISSSLPNACTNIDPDAPGTFQNQNLRDAWVTWWRDNLVLPYKDRYLKILWQPINEPIVSDAEGQWPPSASLLATSYQAWIDMARAAGDTHWIAVSNANWNGDFPTVTDPLNRIVLDRHWYFFYDDYLNTGGYLKHDYDASGNYMVTQPSCASWGTACAEAYADDIYAFILEAETRHGRPHLSLELGAEDSYGSTPPPDHLGSGDCGYSPATLAFLTRLVSHYDTSPSHGYILWPGGDWVGLYGCMDGWGATFAPGSIVDSTPPTVTVQVTPGTGSALLAATASDNMGVTAVTAEVTGPSGPVGNFTLSYNGASGRWEYGQDFAAGNYTYSIRAWDAAGNVAAATGTFSVNPAVNDPNDTTNPRADPFAFFQDPLLWFLFLVAAILLLAAVVARRRKREKEETARRKRRRNGEARRSRLKPASRVAAPSEGAAFRAVTPFTFTAEGTGAEDAAKPPTPKEENESSAPVEDALSEETANFASSPAEKPPSAPEESIPKVEVVAVCEGCNAQVSVDATMCPSCGAQFG